MHTNVRSQPCTHYKHFPTCLRFVAQKTLTLPRVLWTDSCTTVATYNTHLLLLGVLTWVTTLIFMRITHTHTHTHTHRKFNKSLFSLRCRGLCAGLLFFFLFLFVFYVVNYLSFKTIIVSFLFFNFFLCSAMWLFLNR